MWDEEKRVPVSTPVRGPSPSSTDGPRDLGHRDPTRDDSSPTSVMDDLTTPENSHTPGWLPSPNHCRREGPSGPDSRSSEGYLLTSVSYTGPRNGAGWYVGGWDGSECVRGLCVRRGGETWGGTGDWTVGRFPFGDGNGRHPRDSPPRGVQDGV